MADAELPRGTVTFLFSDIENSTELVRRVGNETFAAIRGDQRRLLREAFTAHGGHEIDTAGDGFFVAFDSARDAVQAAIEGQLALTRHGWPDGAEVRVRMGLHTAEPHLGDDGYVGLGVHRASRICDAGRGGQILLSNATAGIVEDAELPGMSVLDLGEHRLKDLRAEQRLFQLSAPGLPASFEPPRTREGADMKPGAGTFLHSDLSGWRHLIRSVGDEQSATLAAGYHAAVTAIVDAHHGVTLELAGDHILAVFRSASDAVRAAAVIRTAVHGFEWTVDSDVDISITLHSGRWSGDPQRPSAGTALSRLYELARSARPGQVLLSSTTAALVEGDRELPELRSVEQRITRDGDAIEVFELVDSG
jgi:class 3 adenylate cyclase